ncbi:restriction endonuclease subunit S, partial [Vibrio diabolicus]
GGVPHINLGILKALEIPLPPLNIQKKIVNIIRSIDQKITLNTQTNQTLEEMAQAIFKSWFVDFDPVKAKMNGEQLEGMDAATASLFPDKLVESELGLIPEGWPVDQVGKHLDVTKGKSYKSAELQESTTALVTLKSFKRGGGYRMDGLKEYTGKYKPQQVIEAGDLVMSLTDVTQAAEIVGKPALVIDAPQYDTLVASLDVAILRPKETDAKQYFYGLMSTYRFHRYAESFATGTTVLHLSPKGITTFEFACPSAELVKKYHEFAAPIFAKIEANILESQELAKLRDTLLPKLLSGEIELGQAQELAEVE